MTYLANYSNPKLDKKLKSKEIQYFQYKKGVKKLKPKSRSVYTYSNGLLVDYKFIKKGKVNLHFAFEYNTKDYYTKFYKGDLDEPKYMETLEYNDSNRVVKYTKYGNNNKLKQSTLNTYNADQQLVRKEVYDKLSTEPRYVWVYKYNEKGGRVETEYFVKGKLKSKWVFTCDDEGDKLKRKEEKLNTTCSIVEHNNDGSYIRIYRNTDEKGREQTSRWTYNKDSMIIAYERRNHKDVITSKYTQEYDSNGKRSLYTSYKRGVDKIRYSTKFKYNANDEVIERTDFNSKGEMKSRLTFVFDESGNIMEYTRYDSKNKERLKYIYSYNKKGELIAKLTTKKQVPKYESKYILNY